jgi:hypothetical protein
LDPRNDELLMFADDGIFRISVERALIKVLLVRGQGKLC